MCIVLLPLTYSRNNREPIRECGGAILMTDIPWEQMLIHAVLNAAITGIIYFSVTYLLVNYVYLN